MNIGDTRQAKYSLAELKELMANATEVVNWYPYMEVDGATVRGPWNRWFRVNEIDYGKEHVSPAIDDAKYAAAAMNALPDLIARIETLQEAVKIAASFLEDSENNYEEHMSNCNFYQAFHPEAQFCNCGVSDWIMKRKKLIVGLNELFSRV